MNASSQSQLCNKLQERPITLALALDAHNLQTIIFINSSNKAQPMTNFNYSQKPIFCTAVFLDASKTPQSIHAPPLIPQSACINSTASSLSTLPISNLPVPSNLSTSSLTNFSSTQSIHATDLTRKAIHMPTHQQLTLPSSSTTHFVSASS